MKIFQKGFLDKLVLALCVISIGIYFVVLQNYYSPEDAVVVDKFYEYGYASASDGRFVRSKAPDYTVLYDGEEKLVFAGHFASRMNLSKGDAVRVIWYSPCHEWVVEWSSSCNRVIAVGDQSFSEELQETIEYQQKFVTFVCFILLLPFLIYWIIHFIRSPE
ncbi:hypothetical protein [Neptuniibacter sp. QD34_54]|uniref:hypothetical protein n=1 Tax=Neptuniibacter sp. QD34_54 TaxID=3398208 RepID=UPI0039F4CF68